MPFLKNATALALATAFISGVSLFINKVAVTGMNDPVLFAGCKNAIVAVFLVSIILVAGKRAEIVSLTKRQWAKLGAIGLIGGSLPFALFFTGLVMIPAANGALIHKTLFVFVALLAVVVLRERFSPMQWLGVGALFVANLVVGGFTGFQGSLGEVLVLAATVLWAVENIIAKRALVELSSITIASARMVIGSGLLMLFLTVTNRMSGLGSLTAENLLWTLLTAGLLLSYVLTWYTALKYAPASYVAALLVPATLVTNVLSAVFVTGNLTEAQAVQGFLLVLGSVLIVLFARPVSDDRKVAMALS